jgi:hypothetical protein
LAFAVEGLFSGFHFGLHLGVPVQQRLQFELFRSQLAVFQVKHALQTELEGCHGLSKAGSGQSVR